MAKKERVSDVSNGKNVKETMGTLEAIRRENILHEYVSTGLRIYAKYWNIRKGGFAEYICGCMSFWDTGKTWERDGRKEDKRTATISPRGTSSSLGERQTGTPRKVQGTKNNT